MNQTLSIEEILAQKADNHENIAFQTTLKNLQANILKHHTKKRALYAFITFKPWIKDGQLTSEQGVIIKEVIKEWLQKQGEKLKSAREQIEERNIYKLMLSSLNKLRAQYKDLEKVPSYLQPLINQVYNFQVLQTKINKIDQLLKSGSGSAILKAIPGIIRSIGPIINELKNISDNFHSRPGIKKIERRFAQLKNERNQHKTWIEEIEKLEISSQAYPINNQGLEDLKNIVIHIDKFIVCFDKLVVQEIKAHFKELRKKRLFFEELSKLILKKNLDADTIKKILQENREKFGADPVGDSLNLIEKIKQSVDEYQRDDLFVKPLLFEIKSIVEDIKRSFAESEITCLHLSYQGYKYFGKEGREIPGGDSLSFQKGLSFTDFYRGRQNDDIETVYENHHKNSMNNKNDECIHVLFLIAWGDKTTREEQEKRVKKELIKSGISLCKSIHFEYGRLNHSEKKESKGKEWFGFKDGINNPKFFPSEKTKRRIDYQEPSNLNIVLTPCKSGSPYNCGSFVTFLKFQQHVKAFEKSCEDIAKKIAIAPGGTRLGEDFKKNLAGALLIGRHKDGTPVTLSRSEHGDVSNHSFDYSNDVKGTKCPLHAHIRKANPREDNEFDKIVRRGMLYGRSGENYEKGLLFMSFQADLESQFEYMLDLRLIKLNWNGEKSGSDPLLSSSSKYRRYYRTWGNVHEAQFTIPNRKLTTFKGGLYFFAPSIPYIKDLVDF